jgi:hypothetical protein
MTCQPVFIDGPLKGQSHVVSENAPDIRAISGHVHYTFHQVIMFGRILIVGTTLPFSSQEADAAAFEVLASDAAKAAVVEVAPPRRLIYLSDPVPEAEPSSQLSPEDALNLIDRAIAEQAEFAKPPRSRAQIRNWGVTRTRRR